MSFAVDANILIYAFNRDDPHHFKAKELIENLSKRDETWLMPWPVIHAFLRITTHPGILQAPLSPGDAVSAMESLRALPNFQTAGELPEFWEIYKNDLLNIPLRGNGVPDAVIANILISHGASTLYTKDRDFLRFKGLKVVEPF